MSSLALRTKARDIVKGRDGEGEERKGMCIERAEREGEEETKRSGLYGEETLEEQQSSPWARKFRVRGRLCQEGTEEPWSLFGALWCLKSPAASFPSSYQPCLTLPIYSSTLPPLFFSMPSSAFLRTLALATSWSTTASLCWYSWVCCLQSPLRCHLP